MAAEHPRISVIVPVYKVERYIERFMASLCESLSRVSPDGVEVVIVDDGSPDDSAALISAFLREHPVRQSIRIIHQPNGGLSSARNRGMAEARGCWVMFLDSDDYISADYISVYYELACSAPTDMVLACGGLTEIDESGRIKVMPPPQSMSEEDVLLWLPMFAVAKLYRLDLVEENGLEFDLNNRGGEDADFLFDYLGATAGKICTVDNTAYYYCRRAGSLSRINYRDYEGKLATYRIFRDAICRGVAARGAGEAVWSHWRRMLGADLYDMIGDLRKDGKGYMGVARCLRRDFSPAELDDLRYFRCRRIRRLLNAFLLLLCRR